MSSTQSVKHICDRCGTSVEVDHTGTIPYPPDWQVLSFGQTGADIDLCAECNLALTNFLVSEGAVNMHLATHKTTKIL